MTNEAILDLPQGYGFRVSSVKGYTAGHNYARIYIRRGEFNTELLTTVGDGIVHTVRASLTASQLVIAAFAGNEQPSVLRPGWRDSGLDRVQSIPFDDTLGPRGDYDDLIVEVIRFKTDIAN